MATPIKCPWNWNYFIFQALPCRFADSIQIHDTFVPWATAVHYQGLVLDSKLIFTRQSQTCSVTFPLLARDSALTQSNKLTLYKLLIWSILTHSAPVWSSTCSSSYLRLQVIQSKCLRVIGNHPICTPTSHLPCTLNIEPTCVITNQLTTKFFAHCPSHPNPLVQQIGNYTLADLTNVQEI